MPARPATKGCLAAMAFVLIGISGYTTLGRAQQPDDEQGEQVLTRGPVHEAFAGVVLFNPEPGILVSKAPPDAIDELPPEERPDGDNVAWIPGYWAWDDERSDFLWVSGTWRALPPGREWVSGYWNETSQGYQWISGYWADSRAQETLYLPAPPATEEAGPNVASPSSDYEWTPGCWVWYRGRYAWRPGYWVEGRADWVWIPANYVWTPRGYIFVEGFWDYSVARRGMLFAPVYFEPGMYARRGHSYSPTVVINVAVFSDDLFLRPRDHHYYFGDYYAASYAERGFFASFSFQSSRRGYDPFYAHQRWQHRQDRDWEHRVEASYQHRRDNESARPPRTWTGQRRTTQGAVESRDGRPIMATTLDRLARNKDGPVTFQPVTREQRQDLVRREQEVRKSRDARRTLEARTEGTTARGPGGVAAPTRAPPLRSPIVAKPANKLGPGGAPPKPPKAPKPDVRVPPRAHRGNPPAETRNAEADRHSTPERGKVRQRPPESGANADDPSGKKGTPEDEK